MRGVLDTMGEDGIQSVIEYRAMDGSTWRQPFVDMFGHLINHCTYRRGQVTTLLRQVRASPPKSTDLIMFHRLGSGSRVG